MESRLPKRKHTASNNDKANRIAANHLKFVEAFPRQPMSMANPENPPLYQGMRSRAISPEPARRKIDIDRHHLRRSRSISDLSHSNILPLKRGAAGTLESIPAKISRTNFMPKPTSTATNIGSSQSSISSNQGNGTKTGTNSVHGLAKSATTGVASKATASTFKRPAAKPVATTSTASKTGGATAAKSTVGAKVPVKRIPSYDYKARFNDLVEKHKIVKEKLAEAESKIDDADRMENAIVVYQEEAAELQEQIESLRQELNNEKSQNKESKTMIKTLNEKVAALESTEKMLTETVESLTTENKTIRPALEQLQRTHKIVVSENSELKVKVQKSEELLFESNIARKQLHNDLLDLKGNIRVFCRVRPALDTEKGKMLCGWQYMDETSLQISSTDGGNKMQKFDFSFDQVFHPQSSQQDIFELVSPLIQSAFDGYNICIFAYGQTGSGKTFTMEGTPSNIGIIPRTVDLLFKSVENYKLMGWTYEISVTFLEIYNEVLYDLLSNEPKDMDIRMTNPKFPHEIYVTNLQAFRVATGEDLRELIEVAHSHRATASTAGNERSSRSHAVTQITLKGTHDERGEICIGKLNLIDLAGSESPKTSNRMDETKNINRSLSELTNVIMALLNQNDHVSYRNSKLTHLLMPSLGGNSKTLMFINVAPFDDCFKESVKSLRFAANVNACKLNMVRKNKMYVE